MEKLVLYANGMWVPTGQLKSWTLWHEQGICLGLPLGLPGISICLPVHAQHSRYLDFDIWCRNSLFIILNMTILSPQWAMTVSVKAEYVATYIFQSKKYSKNGFFENDWFFYFWAVQIYPVGKSLNTSFVNEFIRCFLSPNAFMVCPVGEGGGPVTEWGSCFRAARGEIKLCLLSRR